MPDAVETAAPQTRSTQNAAPMVVNGEVIAVSMHAAFHRDILHATAIDPANAADARHRKPQLQLDFDDL